MGATLGTVLGLLMSLVGVLLMPLVGAVLGELWAQNRLRQRQDVKKALHVGVFDWLGMMAGLLAKVVLGCTMVGVFVVALLV